MFSGSRSESQVRTGNAGVLGGLQRHRHAAAALDGDDGDAVHLLGDEILHDLHLLVAAAVLAGADIHAFEGAVRFRFGLLAAVARLIEERVVHVLRHQSEDVLRLGAGHRYGHGAEGDSRA